VERAVLAVLVEQAALAVLVEQAALVEPKSLARDAGTLTTQDITPVVPSTSAVMTAARA